MLELPHASGIGPDQCAVGRPHRQPHLRHDRAQFNPIMAMAADTVIAEWRNGWGRRHRHDEWITCGRMIDRRDCVSGLMVDKMRSDKRVAQELRVGYLVNLGIGLPTLVACELEQLPGAPRLKRLEAELSLDRAISRRTARRTKRRPA